MTMNTIIDIIVSRFPDTQAIYLFGSYQTAFERDESDVDIALLLLPDQAKVFGHRELIDLKLALERTVSRDFDIVNLRQVDSVFQNEIIFTGQRIYCANRFEADMFEMTTISRYQALNEERKAIIDHIYQTGTIVTHE